MMRAKNVEEIRNTITITIHRNHYRPFRIRIAPLQKLAMQLGSYAQDGKTLTAKYMNGITKVERWNAIIDEGNMKESLIILQEKGQKMLILVDL